MVEKRYWFRAKRYGWGWGLPLTWEGWATLVGFVLLVALGSVVYPPDERIGLYLAWVAIVAIALIAVCWFKGEPPRWRWGGDE